MAIDEGDRADTEQFSDAEVSDSGSERRRTGGPTRGSDVRVGEYTWADFMPEYGYGDEVSELYPHGVDGPDDQLGLDADGTDRPTVPSGDDWDHVEFEPGAYLGYHPDELPELITEVFAPNAKMLYEEFRSYVDPETTPVVKDVYTWEHYKWEYYYREDGSRPRDSEGDIERFDGEEALGFDPDEIERKLRSGGDAARALEDLVEERTVNVREDVDEDAFFSTEAGHTTVANRYDLEKAVPMAKKRHFREVERYWVNAPYAFVTVFHSEKENEKKYYVVEPYLTEIEAELKEFLSGKLRTAIKYADEGIKQKDDPDGKREVIEEETRRLLERYDLFERSSADAGGIVATLRSLLADDEDGADESNGELEGISVRPEPVLLEEDSDTLSEYQVEKLLYFLKRDFIGYERIDGIKHDINVEDVSCDGYNSPVFVYHSEYEQIITNVFHGEDELDDFVVKLAQRSGKGISKRMPQVDATLPDGSRAQLTLGREVSDHGTNYTIRQFKDVPFTPIDLINWNTFSLDEMAFLWLAIENHKSLIFAGGTASGKTTSLNAVSLFIPSNTKIVSIEDTREVELPQRNWIASVTRPSFSEDEQGDVDEFDLLEAALRQRPDYIVMGEIRGEEGRTLFQVMSTGHTTYTTFHADSVDEVLKRFTTDPINVSKTMFTALDLVSIQTQTRVQGRKVRRNKSLTEINHYEAENDEINVQDVYQWQAETDEFLEMGDSNTLEEIKFDRGWKQEKLERELFKRRVILAYLIENDLNTYAEVAATVQAFINDPDTILTLIANGNLEESLEDLREMESVLIDVDPEKEELVPRPEPTEETRNLSVDILERADESLFEEYRGTAPSGLGSALDDVTEADAITVDGDDSGEFEFDGDADGETDGDRWELADGPAEFTFDEGFGSDAPSWLDDDGSFDAEDDAAAVDSEPVEAATAETGSADVDAEPETWDPPALEPAESDPVERPSPSSETGARRAEDEGEAFGGPSDDGSDLDAGDLEPIERPESEGAAGEATSSDDEPADSEAGDRESVDDVEPADLDGLFDDVGSTLEELADVGPEVRDTDEGGEDAPDADATGETGDAESIFVDADPDDESSDGTESVFSGESGSIFSDGESSDDGGGSLFDETTDSPFDRADADEGDRADDEESGSLSDDGDEEDDA